MISLVDYFWITSTSETEDVKGLVGGGGGTTLLDAPIGGFGTPTIFMKLLLG